LDSPISGVGGGGIIVFCFGFSNPVVSSTIDGESVSSGDDNSLACGGVEGSGFGCNGGDCCAAEGGEVPTAPVIFTGLAPCGVPLPPATPDGYELRNLITNANYLLYNQN